METQSPFDSMFAGIFLQLDQRAKQQRIINWKTQCRWEKNIQMEKKFTMKDNKYAKKVQGA